jgi:hypothetical protein
MTIVNHFRWHTGDDGGARYRTPEALAIRAARQKELVLKDGRIDQIPFLSGITAKLYQRWLALMRLSPGQDPKIEAEIIALSNQIRENVELLARFDPLNKSTFDQGDLPLMYQVIINILKPHPDIMRKVEEGFSKIAFNPGEGVKQDGPIVDTGTGDNPKE